MAPDLSKSRLLFFHLLPTSNNFTNNTYVHILQTNVFHVAYVSLLDKGKLTYHDRGPLAYNLDFLRALQTDGQTNRQSSTCSTTSTYTVRMAGLKSLPADQTYLTTRPAETLKAKTSCISLSLLLSCQLASYQSNITSDKCDDSSCLFCQLAIPCILLHYRKHKFQSWSITFFRLFQDTF